MKAVALIALATACGFKPNPSATDSSVPDPDAPPHHQDDAHVFEDAHEYHDAHVYMDAMEQPVFDVTLCPSDYSNTTITSSPGSRYKIITGQQTFAIQNADCNDDHAGWTHLFVIDSITEAQQIRSHVGQAYYVGAVQPHDSADVDAGWLSFTGAAVDPTFWQNGQPNDDDQSFNLDETNEQNFAAVDDSSGLLNDVSGAFQYQAVCECDGLPVSAAAAAAIAGN